MTHSTILHLDQYISVSQFSSEKGCHMEVAFRISEWLWLWWNRVITFVSSCFTYAVLMHRVGIGFVTSIFTCSTLRTLSDFVSFVDSFEDIFYFTLVCLDTWFPFFLLFLRGASEQGGARKSAQMRVEGNPLWVNELLRYSQAYEMKNTSTKKIQKNKKTKTKIPWPFGWCVTFNIYYYDETPPLLLFIDRRYTKMLYIEK